MIELYVFGVSLGISKTETHTLLLKEVAGSKYLMIEIGYSETCSHRRTIAEIDKNDKKCTLGEISR